MPWSVIRRECVAPSCSVTMFERFMGVRSGIQIHDV